MIIAISSYQVHLFTHFGSGFDAIEETLFGVRIDRDEVGPSAGHRSKEGHSEQYEAGGHHSGLFRGGKDSWNYYLLSAGPRILLNTQCTTVQKSGG